MSPAMIVFGRAVRDFIPILPGRYNPHTAWRDNANLRELALRKRHTRAEERLSEHTRVLPPLCVGDHVRIQNQTGNNPRKWERTGIVIEVRQHDQYVVKVDGSGRVTLRNRRFLRKFHLYEPSCHSPVSTPSTLLKGEPAMPTKQLQTSASHSRTSSNKPPTPQESSPHPPQEQNDGEEATVPPDSLTYPNDPDQGSQDISNGKHVNESSICPPTAESAPDTYPATPVAPDSPTPQRPQRQRRAPARYDPAQWDLKR